MTESEFLHRKLDELQNQIYEVYKTILNKLREKHNSSTKPIFPIEIVSEEEEKNLEFDLIVDLTDEVNGGIFSVYVLMINNFGEFIGLDLENNKKDTYSISDISNDYNKIEMIELLESYLNK